jgi:hypothetical protein
VGPKSNGTRQLLFYANDINILCDNIGTVKKNAQTLFEASKEVGLQVNTDTAKYMLLSCQQNAGQNHDMKISTDGLKLWHSLDIWERR